LQDEAPHFEKTYETMQEKIAALQDASGGRPLPVLEEMQQTLNSQFNKATDLCDSVDGKLVDFMSKHEALEEEIQEEMKKVTAIRDRLAAIDDITGDDDAIQARLEETKVCLSFLLIALVAPVDALRSCKLS
jgi:predicted  nucleic acid-binding Zn-ribbon protein